MTVEVIEVDQWSSTGDITEHSFEDVKACINACGPDEVPDIEGGDAEAAQAIFGGRYEVKEVDEDARPRKAMVWYVEGENGEMKQYKANYATK